MKPYRSLRGKITARMLLVSLIPIVIIGTFAGYSMIRAQEEADSSISRSQTEMVDNVVSISLANEATAMGREIYTNEINNIINLSQISFSPVMTGLATGQTDIESAARYLGAQMQITGNFAELTATDAYGTVLASTNAEIYPGTDMTNQPWWTKTQMMAVSIEFIEESQLLQFVYGMRIPNPMDPTDTTKSVGWITGTTLMDPSAKMRQYTEHIERSEIVLLVQGRLLADSANRNRSFQNSSSLDSIEQAAVTAVSNTDVSLAGMAYTTAKGFVMDEENGFVAGYYRPSSADFDGLMPETWNDSILNSEFPTESMIVIMKQPTEAAFSSLSGLEQFKEDLEDSTNFMIIVLGSMLLLAFATAITIASYFSRSIIRPISSLRDGAERISKGEQNVEINITSRDEIGNLANSFNRMTVARNMAEEEVRQHRDHLEETVSARTLELQQEVNVRKQAETTIQQQYNEIQVRQEELEASNNELMHTREQLRQHNETLEDKVLSRTAEVDKLLKHKEEFISQLAHDLRSPLTPMVGLVPIVKEVQTDPKTIEYLEVIESNIGYMRGLVEETLELSTLDSGTAVISLEDVNIGKTITECLDHKHDVFSQNNIQLQNNIIEDISITANALRIQEVIDNLVTNAVKFMPEGGVLTFDAVQDEESVTVSVQDTGIGITEDQARRVFDEFYKADESRHDLDSSGLGLSICRRVVEKHGGTIWVASEGLGKGTTFYFTLPTQATENPQQVQVANR